MALAAHQRRQLSLIESGLRHDDPDLARQLELLRPRAVVRSGLFEALAPLAVNVLGVVLLVVGALLHQTPTVVAGLFLGGCGPLITVAAARVLELRRARRTFGRGATR